MSKDRSSNSCSKVPSPSLQLHVLLQLSCFQCQEVQFAIKKKKGTNELVLCRWLSKSTVGLHEQLFSSYHERNPFYEAHAHARLASCLHSPLQTQSFYHPIVSMDARMQQDASQLSFAYASVWAVHQVVRLFAI